MNSLGLDKAPEDTRVVVAMSGGVDSSVTAALLHQEGYQVVGVTLQLYDHGAAVGRKGACCAGQDIYDARRVADALEMPHYVLDYESRFRAAVMEDFADSYLRGETPIPCVRCNERVKFRDLLDTARDLEAEALATGHYVRRLEGPNGPELHQAVDPARDQSYFLFTTTSAQLELLRFPLGGRPKAETREIARPASCRTAPTPGWWRSCARAPPSPASSSTWRAGSWAAIKGSFTTPSANAGAWASAAGTSRSTWCAWSPKPAGSWWDPKQPWQGTGSL
jgi:tRNA-specific 2-thiouridylase